MARIACILVPDFPVAAIVRTNPELRDRPLALSNSQEGHSDFHRHAHFVRFGGSLPTAPSEASTVVTASPRAKAMGIRPGMTAAQARAFVPELVIIQPSTAAERSAHDALLDAAESFSPLIDDGGPGQVYLDLAGLATIHGTEEAMAAALRGRVAKVGMEAAVGVAASKEVACTAARCGGMRVIEPGQEREFLNWLPLELLDIDAELELVLTRWGIRRLGDLARLDVRALGSRLGARGVELAKLARGEKSAPFVARPHPELFAEAVEFDYGIEAIEPLSFVMHPMLARLVARLELRGLMAGDVTLSLKLSGGGGDDRRVAVAAATNEVRSLLALILLSLEGAPPPTAIEAIRIAIAPRRTRPAQADLFLPPAPAPDRLQITIARLAALCGPDHVGALMPMNSHRPEAVEVVAFDPSRVEAAPSPSPAKNAGEGRTPLALQSSPVERRTRETENVVRLVIRAIRPAEEVEVMCARGGIPEFVRGQDLCARVISIAGPWRRQGEWWRIEAGGGFARDYYDVALADGAVYRMFCDLHSGNWFVDGVYD
ncbi:MAG: DNA polymerase Y family protein [Candidatus Binataceae bacterium]